MCEFPYDTVRSSLIRAFMDAIDVIESYKLVRAILHESWKWCLCTPEATETKSMYCIENRGFRFVWWGNSFRFFVTYLYTASASQYFISRMSRSDAEDYPKVHINATVGDGKSLMEIFNTSWERCALSVLRSCKSSDKIRFLNEVAAVFIRKHFKIQYANYGRCVN